MYYKWCQSESPNSKIKSHFARAVHTALTKCRTHDAPGASIYELGVKNKSICFPTIHSGLRFVLSAIVSALAVKRLNAVSTRRGRHLENCSMPSHLYDRSNQLSKYCQWNEGDRVSCFEPKEVAFSVRIVEPWNKFPIFDVGYQSVDVFK